MAEGDGWMSDGSAASRARLAIDIFCQRVKGYIGAYTAKHGQPEALVLTGGIGENSQRIRRQVCEHLEWAGIKLDQGRNESVQGESRISTDDSATEIWVVQTNEELIVARQTAEAIGQ